jgi:peroxiredoxin
MRKAEVHFAALVLFFATAISFAAPTTQPNELKKMSDAYKSLKSLEMSGSIDLSADIDGQTAHKHGDFTDEFRSPMRFRHEMKDDVIAAGMSDKVYLYVPAQNVYSADDAPQDRGSFASLSDDLRALLRSQDWSLVFALSDNPSAELVSGATDISTSEIEIDARKYATVTASFADRDVTLAIDPTTHLVRRVMIDASRGLIRRGANVKEAKIVIDYTKIVPGSAISDDQLAFVPPATAQLMEVETADAMSLIGKPAPKFRLPQLGGGQVSDADLKGSVYVLDFWASWCGPCVQSLPQLDELYKQTKGDGAKFFAVNLEEPAAATKDFAGRLNLSIPVLLDADGKVGIAYGASAIPETVVVGRDGVVRNVFVGAGQEPDIAAAVQAALAGKAAGQ